MDVVRDSFLRMIDLAYLAGFGVAALVVVWIANGLVGLLSGDRPRDTSRLWIDAFLRFFIILEMGIIGRVLNYCGMMGWRRRIIFYVGVLCLLIFLVEACRDLA